MCIGHQLCPAACRLFSDINVSEQLEKDDLAEFSTLHYFMSHSKFVGLIFRYIMQIAGGNPVRLLQETFCLYPCHDIVDSSK